jgi:hypothetical protein
MNSEDEKEILQNRILDAKKNWQLFLSELPLRETNLSLVKQTLNTEVETSQEINDTEELHSKYKFLLKPNSAN